VGRAFGTIEAMCVDGDQSCQRNVSSRRVTSVVSTPVAGTRRASSPV
jgi:hypothetical protein